jgi:hypothetical protein
LEIVLVIIYKYRPSNAIVAPRRALITTEIPEVYRVLIVIEIPESWPNLVAEHGLFARLALLVVVAVLASVGIVNIRHGDLYWSNCVT